MLAAGHRLGAPLRQVPWPCKDSFPRHAVPVIHCSRMPRSCSWLAQALSSNLSRGSMQHSVPAPTAATRSSSSHVCTSGSWHQLPSTPAILPCMQGAVADVHPFTGVLRSGHRACPRASQGGGPQARAAANQRHGPPEPAAQASRCHRSDAQGGDRRRAGPHIRPLHSRHVSPRGPIYPASSPHMHTS